jgi:adenylylsulfate kinase-like enzyme
MRRTTPEIKPKDAMPTSKASIMLIKGVSATSKASVAHVMEESLLQTMVAVMVDNAVPTRKWSILEATSVTISAPT